MPALPYAPHLPCEKSPQHSFLSTLAPSENSGDAQLYRLFSVIACRTPKELALHLGLDVSAVRKAIKRVRAGEQIPDAWLVHLMRLGGVSPEWILTGKGPSLMHGLAERDAQGPSLAEQEALRSFSSRVLLQELLRRV